MSGAQQAAPPAPPRPAEREHPPPVPPAADSPAPRGASPPPPQRSAPPPPDYFTWEFIWQFFVRAPRIRSWLFQKHSPPSEHVVQALLSSPILTGYVFGSYSERVRSYAFPDIGDLHAVFCSDADALLGFHFGFQGVQPVMPLLFQVAKDPSLGNPNVVVRRTARQKAPFPGTHCYLAIEFNWFASGALAVATSINPVDAPHIDPTGLTAFFDRGEIRVFKRPTAERLSRTADAYARAIDMAYFPHPTHFTQLPPDFLEPPDDYYTLTIREPEDPVYRATLHPAYIPTEEQTFHVEQHIPINPLHPPSHLASVGGTPRHCHRGTVTSVADARTITLWKGYQNAVAFSRRAGIFATMTAKKMGGRFGKVVSLFGREVRYTFLSTSGINVHGRIQRLCNQLGILYSSPLSDTALVTARCRDETAFPRLGRRHQPDAHDGVESELDISHRADSTTADWANRNADAVDSVVTAKQLISLQDDASAAPLQAPWILASGDDASGSHRSSEANSFLPTSSPSVSTDLFPLSSERDSPDGHIQRNPKRRRFSPVTSSGDNALESREDPSSFALHAQQPGADTDAAEDASLPSNLAAQLQQDEALLQTARPQTMQPNRVRRRTFDITDMLSDSKSFYPSNDPNLSGDVSSVTEGATGSSGNATSSIQFQQEDGTMSKNAHTTQTAPAANAETKEPLSTGKGSKTVWTCDRCGVQIRGKKGNLNRHIANKHDNIRAYACKEPNCGRKFQTRLNLVRHETAVHLGRPFLCPNCPRAFKYENDLNAHVKSAHEEADAKLACEICGSCFGRRSTLNRHKTKVHKMKKEPDSVV